MYPLEENSLRPALEAALGVKLEEGIPDVYIDDDLDLYVGGLGADYAYIASELGANGVCLKSETEERQEAVAFTLARPWRVFRRCEPSEEKVYGTVLLPLYFGPTRSGLQWARVAASTAVLYHILKPGADITLTLALLKKAAAKMAELVEQNRELYSMYDLAYAVWTTDRCRYYDDVKREAEHIGELRDFYYKGGDRCLDFLLAPYNPERDPGRVLAKLGNARSSVIITATESFSPATLYHLRNAEKIYLLYTPNVYKQVKYAIDVAYELMPDLKNKIKRVLLSSYNPHINYKALKHALEQALTPGQQVIWHPKLSGPMPVYLALKKLEAEGYLSDIEA